MFKFKEMILMLCFILSGALCYVHGEDRTENEKGEGIPIEVIEFVSVSGTDKGNSIIPTLDDHFLIVVFNENLGQVSVEVATAAGAILQSLSVYTPNGVQVYIPNAGNYLVTFTLSNGDVYAGEFMVTN